MSQEPIAGPEDLTPLQRRYLRNLREYCDEPPTLAKIYAKTWRHTLILLLLAGAGIGVALMLDRVLPAFFVVGMVLGVLIRDLAFFKASLKLWPATKAVLDRDRLEELTVDPPHDSYTHDGP